MTKEQQQVREFHEAVHAATGGEPDPITPTMPSYPARVLRAKLILEEALETIIKGLGVNLNIGSSSLLTATSECKDDLNWTELHPGNLVEIADGAADLKYVICGMELKCGIDGDSVFQEVHESNMTKFIDGSRRGDGKWVKGPSYKPANVLRVIEAQMVTEEAE